MGGWWQLDSCFLSPRVLNWLWAHRNLINASGWDGPESGCVLSQPWATWAGATEPREPAGLCWAVARVGPCQMPAHCLAEKLPVLSGALSPCPSCIFETRWSELAEARCLGMRFRLIFFVTFFPSKWLCQVKGSIFSQWETFRWTRHVGSQGNSKIIKGAKLVFGTCSPMLYGFAKFPGSTLCPTSPRLFPDIPGQLLEPGLSWFPRSVSFSQHHHLAQPGPPSHFFPPCTLTLLSPSSPHHANPHPRLHMLTPFPRTLQSLWSLLIAWCQAFWPESHTALSGYLMSMWFSLPNHNISLRAQHKPSKRTASNFIYSLYLSLFQILAITHTHTHTHTHTETRRYDRTLIALWKLFRK